eukprot:INCI19902.1.p1 GENE.INCI19902.1~~INCI19902.1.p1  ORF type:complete len:688 (-),score=112.94 INCI19902.1:39-2102(-)
MSHSHSSSAGLLSVTKEWRKNTRQRPGGPGADKSRNVSSGQGSALLLAAPPRWKRGALADEDDEDTGPVVLGASATRLDSNVKDTVIADGKHLNASAAAAPATTTTAGAGATAGVAKKMKRKLKDEDRIAELEAELARLKQFKKKQVDKVMAHHNPSDESLANKYQYDNNMDYSDPRNFCPGTEFTGSRRGFIFQRGPNGLGYYRDTLLPRPDATPSLTSAKASLPRSASATIEPGSAPTSADVSKRSSKSKDTTQAPSGTRSAPQTARADDRRRDRSPRRHCDRSRSRDRGAGGAQTTNDHRQRRARSRSRDRRGHDRHSRSRAEHRRHSSERRRRSRSRSRDRDRRRRRHASRSHSLSRHRSRSRSRRKKEKKHRSRRKRRSRSSSTSSEGDSGGEGHAQKCGSGTASRDVAPARTATTATLTDSAAAGAKVNGADTTCNDNDDISLFDFNANIIAERVAELENAKVSPRRTAVDVLDDIKQCFADDVRVLSLSTGQQMCSREEFFALYVKHWSTGSSEAGGAKPKRMDLQKRVFMQRQNCQRASTTTTFALDFKRYFWHGQGTSSVPTPFWAHKLLSTPTAPLASTSPSASFTDVAFLFMALRNKIHCVYIAPDPTGIGADQTLKLDSPRFKESTIFQEALQYATNLSDSSLGDLDVHFHDYHSIEEVNIASIMAAAAQRQQAE